MKDYLEKAKISEGATVRQAMAAIDAGNAGVALVVCVEGKLVGILTDGDLRRALLGGAEMMDFIKQFVRSNFISVKENTPRADVLDLMKAYEIEHVPVLDSELRLVGWHLVREMISNTSLPNSAVVMAGGKGSRLGGLTTNMPKPMLKVAGRPILERIILHLVGAGIRKVYLSVNYLSHIIEDHFGNGEAFGCEIEYLREDEPLGSGGSLSLLPPQEESILLMNGDLVTDFDVQQMFYHHNACNALGTMGLQSYRHQVPYGCVKVKGNEVKSLVEKPYLDEIINTGIYILSPELIKRVEKRFYPVTELFENCIKNNEKVAAFRLDSEWIDVGQADDLNLARGAI